MLVSKVKKKPSILAELHSRQQAKLSREDAVSNVVDDLNERNVVIDKAQQVQSLAQAAMNIALPAGSHRSTITLKEVTTVMKRDHGMRYRKIVDVAVFSNSERNLVLRQRWALEFLTLARNKHTFLAVDETWLGMSDFRRRKWQEPGTTNSVPKLAIKPRVTMILGVDSLGNIYYSLAQANSNSSMMELFYRELVVVLDRDKPSWRKTTVIVADGASYH